MTNFLDNPHFFTDAEVKELRTLGLWQDGHTTPAKLALAGLMLAPVMQITMYDHATSSTEFQSIEEYVRLIEREFELATKEDLESIGTEMGLLPMVKSTWNTLQFITARSLLRAILGRLEETDAHDIRNAVAKACLDVARAAGAHWFSMHVVESKEGPLIHQIIYDLNLESTAEGLHLLGKTGNI